MIVRKLFPVVVSALAVVVSYYLLNGVQEWLRIRAGIGSDTASPIDIAAWQGCVFVAAMIVGCLSRGLLRSAGPIGIVVVLCALAICLAAQLDERCGGSLQMDALRVISGAFAFPVLAWIVSAGFALGWAISLGHNRRRETWITVAILGGALVTLFIVFYPLDKYFARMWGNG